MTIPYTPIDLGALHALLVAAESAVEDERAYTRSDGTPTYNDRRSVRMIVRDQALAKCAGMLPQLLAVYEAACAVADARCPSPDTCGDGYTYHGSACPMVTAPVALTAAVDRARRP